MALAKPRSITDHLPGHREFDAVCSVTANLLDVPDVRAWVAKSFPIVLVDEAQDLTRERLSIVKSLAKNSILLVAADEFQCLQNALRPNPFSEWSVAELNPQRLERVWRTDVADLLGAAATIRDGRPPPTGRDFQTIAAPNANLAGTYLANQIGWRGRNNSIAVLAPTITRYVSDTVNWAQANRTRQGNGPYAISWERTEQAEFTDLCARLNMPARATNAEALVAIGELGTRVASDLRSWLWKQRNVLGITKVSRTDVELAIEASLANRRRFARASNPKLSAMTIHAAKNREFDGVVLLWPFQVGGDADQKRRLLYNAITRARKWCIVLAQGQAILNAPPFA